MAEFPAALSVTNAGEIQRMDVSEYDNDPRGILWVWRPPTKFHKYVMGIDPTGGRTNWSRFNRTRDDAKVDNGCIEVVQLGRRKGGHNEPDQQVAEFAAPVDPYDLAYIANIVGRIYAGVDEDQCGCIVEVTGVGAGTFRQLLELGYTNQFRWEKYASTTVNQTQQMGWIATNSTNKDLWIKASRHINLRNAIIRSPWLVEEYADCRMDTAKEYASNPGGHDDRVRAFNLALWMANGWSLNIERTEEDVRETSNEPPSWQASDCTWEEIQEGWDKVLDRMGGDY